MSFYIMIVGQQMFRFLFVQYSDMRRKLRFSFANFEHPIEFFDYIFMERCSATVLKIVDMNCN